MTTIEEDVREMGRQAQSDATVARQAQAEKRVDPAPDPVKVAEQQAAQLVGNIAAAAKLSLRDRRDELDNLMERMSKAEERLVRFITQFAEFSVEAMNISQSIKAEIADAVQPFRGDPPATITANGKGEE